MLNDPVVVREDMTILNISRLEKMYYVRVRYETISIPGCNEIEVRILQYDEGKNTECDLGLFEIRAELLEVLRFRNPGKTFFTQIGRRQKDE